MFCPNCSKEVASDRVRFCTHCRFPVGAMKDFIATETSKNDAEEEKKFYPLRQQDITLGAGLMIIGALKATLASMASSGSKYQELFVFLFVIGLVFSAAIMFSQLSPRQRGLTVGATIIFLGSLLGIVAGLTLGGPAAMWAVISVFLVVSMFWTHLTSAFLKVFFDKDGKREKTVYAPPQPAFNATDTAAPALPSAQNVAVADLNTQQPLKPEMAERFSITEDSTQLLKNKQSFNPL